MLLGIRAKIRNGPLLKWRELTGLSQADAAKAADVHMTTWNTVECLNFGRSVSLENIVKIANCVGSTVDEIWPESLRGTQIETIRTAYRSANPERLLSECSRSELLSLPAPEVEMDEPIEREHLRERLDSVMRTLSFRERETLKMRYGLNEDGRKYTLEECAKKFQITKERLRQVELRAIRNLQNPIRARKLAEFV